MALFDGLKNIVNGVLNPVKEFIAPIKDVVDFAGDIVGVKSAKAEGGGGTAKPFMDQLSTTKLELTGSPLGSGSQIPKQTVTTAPAWFKFLRSAGGEELMRAVSQQVSKTVVKESASQVVNPVRRKK